MRARADAEKYQVMEEDLLAALDEPRAQAGAEVSAVD
jgi:hypothetical protein